MSLLREIVISNEKTDLFISSLIKAIDPHCKTDSELLSNECSRMLDIQIENFIFSNLEKNQAEILGQLLSSEDKITEDEFQAAQIFLLESIPKIDSLVSDLLINFKDFFIRR